MDRFDRIMRGLRRFQKNTGRFIMAEAREQEEELTFMVTERQLYDEGINAEEIAIASYRPYTPYTVKIKRGKNQPTDRVTLRDTGDYHKSARIEIEGEQFRVRFEDWKSKELREKYGEEVEMLTDENLQVFTNKFVAHRLERELRKNL